MQAQVKHVLLVCLASKTTLVNLSSLCNIAAIQYVDMLLERLANNQLITARESTSRALREITVESTSRAPSEHFESTSVDHFREHLEISLKEQR